MMMKRAIHQTNKKTKQIWRYVKINEYHNLINFSKFFFFENMLKLMDIVENSYYELFFFFCHGVQFIFLARNTDYSVESYILWMYSCPAFGLGGGYGHT
jgi:hypothetical protein